MTTHEIELQQSCRVTDGEDAPQCFTPHKLPNCGIRPEVIRHLFHYRVFFSPVFMWCWTVSVQLLLSFVSCEQNCIFIISNVFCFFFFTHTNGSVFSLGSVSAFHILHVVKD